MSSDQNRSLQARLLRRLEEAPDRKCLAWLDRKGAFRWRSRAEVYRRAAGYAAVMADKGLRGGDVCVLVLPSEEFASTALLATLLLGARPVLVAPPVVRGLHSNLKGVLMYLIRKTGARMVVGTDQERPLGPELADEFPGTVLLFDETDLAGGDPDALVVAQPDAEDVAALQLTSGTTGFPRVCVWKHRGVLAALDGMIAAMGLGEDDVYFNWTPLYHDMGLINNFFLCLFQGIPLVMLPTMDFIRKPALWLRGLSDTGATTTWSPNFGFAISAQRIRDRELEDVRLDRVTAFWNAAERIHHETMVEFHRRFAPWGVEFQALKTNFGCAENVGGATFSAVDGPYPVERVDRARLFEEGLAVVPGDESEVETISVVGVGRAYPGMRLAILDPEGHPLPDGQVGEIALETPSRMEGYLDEPEETSYALVGDLLRSGDVGYLRNGELFWTGRAKERINLHGKKFDPSDFEQVLLRIEGLRTGCFAAFGVDEPALGTQRLVLVTEVRDDAERPADEIMSEIREQVLLQLGPTVSDILLMPQGSMTKTSSGKRRHRHYRELYQGNTLRPVARLGER